MKKVSRLLPGFGIVLLFAMNAGPQTPSCVPNPVPCTTDSDCVGAPHEDCEGDFACVAGYCQWTCKTEGCQSDADCPAGEYCNLVLLDGDATDPDSALPGVCTQNPEGACVKDGDCAKGETCVKGICPMCMGCPCFGECKPSTPVECKQDSDCKTGQFCDSDNLCEDYKCIEEGGHGVVYPWSAQCCPDLKSISCSKPDSSGQCGQCVGAFYCTKCGDGQCKAPENKCNCPEDCADTVKCKLDSDCEEGQFCSFGSVCSPIPDGQCISDSDCADGESCVKENCLECFTMPCPCLGKCQPATPVECRQDSDCKTGQFCDSNNECKDYGCIKEGGSGVVYPWSAQCCPDLKSISCSKPDADGQCGQCAGAFYCTKCGDGQCKAPENKCNCPEDCADTAGCKVDADCPAGQYCKIMFDGDATDPDSALPGVCTQNPEGACVKDGDCAKGESCAKGVCPMCMGCPCFGKCLPVAQSGCKSDKDCKDGEYCAFEDGKCGGVGQCAERPQYCYMAFVPVCGCDNKTYDNACFAASVGVSVAHSGKCQCTSDADCPAGQSCVVYEECPPCVYADPACEMPCEYRGECEELLF